MRLALLLCAAATASALALAGSSRAGVTATVVARPIGVPAAKAAFADHGFALVENAGRPLPVGMAGDFDLYEHGHAFGKSVGELIVFQNAYWARRLFGPYATWLIWRSDSFRVGNVVYAPVPSQQTNVTLRRQLYAALRTLGTPTKGG
jgi:hypothetical protein